MKKPKHKSDYEGYGMTGDSISATWGTYWSTRCGLVIYDRKRISKTWPRRGREAGFCRNCLRCGKRLR